MIRFKQFINKASFLLEKKDHLIRRLKNLSDEQKEEIIDFFRRKPNLENRIDWNNRNLTYDDFRPVMAPTKTEIKRKFKLNGISGLKKGRDYYELDNGSKTGYKLLIPLNNEVSKLLASNKIGACEGQWCIAYEKTDFHWLKHTLGHKQVPIFMFTPEKKYALMADQNGKIEIWDEGNNMIPENEFFEHKGVLDFIRKNKRKLSKIHSDYFKADMWFREGINNGNIVTKNASYSVKDGEFTWEGGTWKRGTWKRGTWENGVWEDGLWQFGTWKNGIWKYGTWERGTWIDGTWERGTWINGSWKGGTWERGEFADSFWYDGVWETGTFIDSNWYDGTWKNGDFRGKEWHKGTWENGNWFGGTWRDGTWENGKWIWGIWKGGTWKNGTWIMGMWKGGTWLGGYDEKGNYHPEGDSPDKW